MVGHIQLHVGDDLVDSFSSQYSFLENLKGDFIRAAIDYLTILSAKIISRQLLLDENIIDAGSDEATVSEDILIVNYRYRIDTALCLLQSWCRQPTNKEYHDLWKIPEFTPVEGGGVPIEQVVDAMNRRRRRVEAYEKGPRPMPDSIMPADVSIDFLYDMVDSNYYIDRIPRTLPPVLRELKLHGLHYYLANGATLDYEHVQGVISFLDKVMPYVRVVEMDPEDEPVRQIRALFAACPEDGRIDFG